MEMTYYPKDVPGRLLSCSEVVSCALAWRVYWALPDVGLWKSQLAPSPCKVRSAGPCARVVCPRAAPLGVRLSDPERAGYVVCVRYII